MSPRAREAFTRQPPTGVEKVKPVYKLPLEWEEYREWLIEYDKLLIMVGPNNRQLKRPVLVYHRRFPSRGDLDVLNYVLCSLASYMPSLIPYVLENSTVFKLAKHLRRHRSSSQSSLRLYIYYLRRFTEWMGQSPDQIVFRILDKEGVPRHREVKWIREQLEEYLGELMADGLSPKSISVGLAAVKTWLEVNGVEVGRIPKPKIYEKYRPRAFTPEEVQMLIDVADLRGKVIVSILATSGMRISTLASLKYKHVKRDLERGVTPIHIHVDAEATKGKYAEYDTFINREAAEYLKLYLEARRRGSPSKKIPPEEIGDESPLIRDARFKAPKPVTPVRIYRIIHNLCLKAGLIRRGAGRRYELCAHSLRKYFKTQMTAAGVPQNIIEYMMGHKTSTYLDVRSLGIEKLREIYVRSGISIKPKTRVSKLEVLKEIIRSLGLDPEKILVKEALEEPHRTELEGIDIEEKRLKVLRETLRRLLLEEAVETLRRSRNL